MSFDDWRPAPNIASDPSLYERENQALARDGRLQHALLDAVAPAGRTVLDIGCGTGFWLPRWEGAARVIGVEPDPRLLELARERVADRSDVEVLAGSAEHLPLPDHSVDVANARFAYFFGPGSDVGLAEVARVLRPGGSLVVVDNSWRSGDFVDLLRDATGGNADHDPRITDRWWQERGATRTEVEGGWAASSPDELEAILRLEFPSDTVDRWIAAHPGRSALSYAFALFRWSPR